MARKVLGQISNGTRQILVWVFSRFFFPCVHMGGIFPGTHTPAGPSHTSPWSLPAKLRQHHTGLLRSLNPCKSHWRKRSRYRSFLQLARKVVSSHSQSSQRPPLLHTQMEKYSKQRILRQLRSGSRAIGSCFSSVPQTQEGLYSSGEFLYTWLLPEEMLQIHPIYSQQSWLSKGNSLADSLQERPNPHRIHEGSAIRQMMPFPIECIGTGVSPKLWLLPPQLQKRADSFISAFAF